MVKKKEEVVENTTEESIVIKREPKKRASRTTKKSVEEKVEPSEEPVMVEEKVEAVKSKKYVVTADWFLNVRSNPSYNGIIVRQLKKGTEVEVFDVQDEWGRIGLNEWVSMKFLR